VLPDVLHPRRWWGAWVILEALVLHLVLKVASGEIAERLGLELSEPRWRAPGRWRRQLMDRLWPWWSRTLGADGPAETRGEGKRRLTRLVAQAGASVGSWASGLAERLVAKLARHSHWLGHAGQGPSAREARP
jgi:hypothetical protein